jgi:hypothetical protein
MDLQAHELLEYVSESTQAHVPRKRPGYHSAIREPADKSASSLFAPL